MLPDLNGKAAVIAGSGLALLCLASAAGAARQGASGPSSDGLIAIMASIPVRATLSGAADVELLPDATLARLSVCVLSNSRPIPFAVTADGGGPDGSFTISSGAQIARYRAQWSAAQGPVLHPAANVAPAADRSQCSEGRGAAELTLSLDRPMTTAGSPYTGSLTLTLAPQ